MNLLYYFTTVGEMFLDPILLLPMLLATFLGIVVGMLPGLTATMGVALLTGLTFGFPTSTAIAMLICVYIGAIYEVVELLYYNIPGTPANAATTLDGFPLARRASS